MEKNRSESFYIRVYGSHALFTNPYSKGGGEKVSYPIATKQALLGIVDACYWKPVLKNVIEEFKVMNPIRTQVRGARALLRKGGADLNFISYLSNPEYLVKYHFVWDETRDDLSQDRNMVKHSEIARRSLKKGGRRDIFLGTRECVGYVELISQEEYESSKSYYCGERISFGLMFDSFLYPKKTGEKLISRFSNVEMIDGIVKFDPEENFVIENQLSNYSFKYPEKQKGVDEELEEYKEEEGRS